MSEPVADTGFDDMLRVSGKTIREGRMGPDDFLVLRAAATARSLHEGQTDKAGKPYIDHPRRVAERLTDPVDKVIAWLHDTVEDTPFTVEDVRVMFGDEIAEAVAALTHDLGYTGSHHESLVDYYARVRGNERARRVKKADIADNTDPERLDALPPALRARLETKYALALQVLDWEPDQHTLARSVFDRVQEDMA